MAAGVLGQGGGEPRAFGKGGACHVLSSPVWGWVRGRLVALVARAGALGVGFPCFPSVGEGPGAAPPSPEEECISQAAQGLHALPSIPDSAQGEGDATFPPARLDQGAGQAPSCSHSPSGKKFRSKPQLARYLGGSMDLSTFDFRTGKMLMTKVNKSRQRVRYDSSNQVKGKPDLNTALPVRQTASIFKQPVTKITNHPSNKVKSDPQKAVDQPRQLFWEKKLSGLNAFDIAEELVKTMDLPKGLQGEGRAAPTEPLLSAIASALHTSSTPITGQLSAAVEKNPGVWLNTAQPLCKAFMVTDEDIRKQEELVQQVRKRLEEALMADMLAHVEELARDGDAPLAKACAEDEEDEDEDDEPEQDPELERV
ncbi:methyl-CpG-binding domain protein 3 [Tupaia chinensis]|uniref:methyl-CpG-binding domain protein 3 n=1 Tax=Tupaia chinensis TaxID=246437 RepID=UPI0007044B47|nr:methyl-CpG-binding domain protein 3 [Tupaia chinensis]